MTERRRPLEHDDAQGALFGGDAFAPARPGPDWQRDVPASRGRPRTGTDGVPIEAATDASDTDAAAPTGFAPTGDASLAAATAPGAFETCVDENAATPTGFEAAAGSAEAPALGTGTAARVRPPSPFADEIAELERATDARSPRSPRAPLAGPTLDDVVSRVWEGLATGLPAACPVCHGEVAPAIGGPPLGRCSSCGTTMD